ncbi:MAG: hypothetical protein ABEK29_00400 [Bradymonadaceae bacterium]
MSRRVATYFGLLAAVALVSSGCLSMSTSQKSVPTKELVSTDFVGEHSVRYLLEDAGTVTVGGSSSESSGSAAQKMMSSGDESSSSGDSEQKKIQFYHLYVEVCDIGANDEENNCKSSKVLDRIVRRNTYETQRRQVTDMFWNSSDTLFVSYLSPKPSVKSCQVTGDNTLQCSDQPNINSILNKKKVFKTNVSTK